jgi:hypothetical protein
VSSRDRLSLEGAPSAIIELFLWRLCIFVGFVVAGGVFLTIVDGIFFLWRSAYGWSSGIVSVLISSILLGGLLMLVSRSVLSGWTRYLPPREDVRIAFSALTWTTFLYGLAIGGIVLLPLLMAAGLAHLLTS